MGTTTKTLIKYRNALLEYGLIKKIVKQKSSSEGYDHNLYQIILLDKENILYPPAEKLPEESEKVISGIAGKFSFQDNPKKVIIDNKKSIDRTILNYSLEDIEEKLDLLKIKRNIVNPAGWLITALQVNYLNPESSREEDDGIEEEEQKNKIEKSEKIRLEQKEKEEKDRLFMEESLKWIEQNLVQRLEM